MQDLLSAYYFYQDEAQNKIISPVYNFGSMISILLLQIYNNLL